MSQATAVTRRYLSVASAAEYADVSQETIRRLIKAGALTPFRPVGGRLLVDVRELDRVIRQSANRPSTRGRQVPARCVGSDQAE